MSSKSATPSIASQVSRRRFLRDLGLTTGGVISGASLLGCEVAEVKVSGGSGATALAFDLADAIYAELKTVGGMYAVTIGTTKVLLVRTADATIAAVSRICPHAQCDLTPDGIATWVAASSTIRCGCHGSEFKPDGSYVTGSVNGGGKVGNLDSFTVQFDAAAGTGIVDLAGVA